MKATLVLVSIVIQQLIKRKIFFGLMISILFLISLGMIFSTFVLTEFSKVVVDTILMTQEIVLLLIVLFLGSQRIYNEKHHKTLDLYRMQGLSLKQIVSGWYGGFLSVMVLVTLVMMSIYFLMMSVFGLAFDMKVVVGLWGSWMVAAILLPWIWIVSSLSQSFLGFIAGLVIYFLGHMMSYVLWYVTIFQAQDSPLWYRGLIHFLYVVIPNFQILNVKDQLLSPFGLLIYDHSLYLVIYALVSSILLILTAKILSRSLR